MSVAEKVQVGRRGPRFRPAILVHHQRRRVVDHRPARPRHQPWLQRLVTVGVVQRARRPTQIVGIAQSGPPYGAGRLERDRKVIFGKNAPAAVFQMQVFRLDLNAVPVAPHIERLHRLLAVPERQAGAVLETAFGMVFHPDQPVGQDAEARAAADDHRFWRRDRSDIQLEMRGDYSHFETLSFNASNRLADRHIALHHHRQQQRRQQRDERRGHL
jgi:hypothetical protein